MTPEHFALDLILTKGREHVRRCGRLFMEQASNRIAAIRELMGAYPASLLISDEEHVALNLAAQDMLIDGLGQNLSGKPHPLFPSNVEFMGVRLVPPMLAGLPAWGSRG